MYVIGNLALPSVYDVDALPFDPQKLPERVKSGRSGYLFAATGNRSPHGRPRRAASHGRCPCAGCGLSRRTLNYPEWNNENKNENK
jgi:hypothetical protein